MASILNPNHIAEDEVMLLTILKDRVRDNLKNILMKEAEKTVDIAVDLACKDLEVALTLQYHKNYLDDTIKVLVTHIQKDKK